MRDRRIRPSILSVALAIVAGCGGGADAPQRATQSPSAAPQAPPAAQPAPPAEDIADELEVPYVPTPEPVVDRMLEMARVDKDDLLYDLGSGDGRIVVTAARRYGARGVGYDLNPVRIKESTENAERAGVADRVRFVQGDLFEADLSEATVVTLYLLPDVNLRLRPKLLGELRPGTRVVSHNYHMGDWEPEETATVKIDGGEHYVYAWTIPARGKAGS